MDSMKTLCQALVIASAIALIDARPQAPASANGQPSNPKDRPKDYIYDVGDDQSDCSLG